MKSKISTLLFLFILIITNSCNKKEEKKVSKNFEYKVPKSTALVYTVNIAEMEKKGEFNYDELIKKMAEASNGQLDANTVIGKRDLILNFNDPVYIYGTAFNTGGMTPGGYVACKFTTAPLFVTSIEKDPSLRNQQWETINGCKILTFTNSGEEITKYLGVGVKGNEGIFLLSSKEDIKTQIVEQLNLKKADLLIADKTNKFEVITNNKQNNALWMNTACLKEIIPAIVPYRDSLFTTFGLDEYTITATQDFEKGIIKSQGGTYVTGNAKRFLNELVGDKGISKELAELIPTEGVTDILTANINLNAILGKEWIQQVIDMYALNSMSFKSKELNEMLGNELIYVNAGNEIDNTYGFPMTTPKILFGISIKDKERVKSAISSSIPLGDFENDTLDIQNLKVVVTDKHLFIFTKGVKLEKNPSSPYIASMTSKPLFQYRDPSDQFETLFGNAKSMGIDLESLAESFPLKESIGSSMKTEDGLISSSTTKLKKSDKNSLYYVGEWTSKFVLEMYKLGQKQKASPFL